MLIYRILNPFFSSYWERDNFLWDHERVVSRILRVFGRGFCPTCGTIAPLRGTKVPRKYGGGRLPFDCGEMTW